MATAGRMTAIGQLAERIGDGKLIVVCGRADDADAWMTEMGEERCLAIGLDEVAMAHRNNLQRNESGRLAFHHEVLAGLDGSGLLATHLDTFDPDRQAILITPDPLDPSQNGVRGRLGRRASMWQLCENKTAIDIIWDRLDIPRPRCVIADSPVDLSSLGKLVDDGDGVVCAIQPATGIAASGAEGIWWWHETPPSIQVGPDRRVKIMPLLRGVPIRLHGMAFANAVVPFTPLETITLPRPGQSTFLCCGATARVPNSASLRALTELIGRGLCDVLGYRGAFSVDGILTADGFKPTDLNTRLTSAFEASPPQIRVELQAANVLARENIDLVDCGWLDQISEEALPQDTVTIYGATDRVDPDRPKEMTVRWESGRLVEAMSVNVADAHIRIEESLRGWTLTVRLERARLPEAGYVGAHAPAIFQFADRVLGTAFGPLAAPFGLEGGSA